MREVLIFFYKPAKHISVSSLRPEVCCNAEQWAIKGMLEIFWIHCTIISKYAQVSFCKLGTREGSAFECLQIPAVFPAFSDWHWRSRMFLKVQMEVLRDVPDKSKLNSSTASLDALEAEDMATLPVKNLSLLENMCHMLMAPFSSHLPWHLLITCSIAMDYCRLGLGIFCMIRLHFQTKQCLEVV